MRLSEAISALFVLQMMPNMSCDHCVLRARYNAHKPGETIFYQCADIRIVAAFQDDASERLEYLLDEQDNKYINRVMELSKVKQTKRQHISKFMGKSQALKPVFYGFAFNPFHTDVSHYVSVDPMTGETKKIQELDFGVDVSVPRSQKSVMGNRMTMRSGNNAPTIKYIMDSVLTLDPFRGTTVLMLHDTGDLDEQAKVLLQLGIKNGSVVTDPIYQFNVCSPNALVIESAGSYLAFCMWPSAQKPGIKNIIHLQNKRCL